jgi:hypothetical protein
VIKFGFDTDSPTEVRLRYAELICNNLDCWIPDIYSTNHKVLWSCDINRTSCSYLIDFSLSTRVLLNKSHYVFPSTRSEADAGFLAWPGSPFSSVVCLLFVSPILYWPNLLPKGVAYDTGTQAQAHSNP